MTATKRTARTQATPPAAKAKPKAPRTGRPKDQRPYILESSLVENDMDRHRQNALQEIEAITAEILSIEVRANNDIQAIRATADTDKSSRTARIKDLERIVTMADHALAALQPPAETREPVVGALPAPDENAELDRVLREQRTAEADTGDALDPDAQTAANTRLN